MTSIRTCVGREKITSDFEIDGLLKVLIVPENDSFWIMLPLRGDGSILPITKASLVIFY